MNLTRMIAACATAVITASACSSAATVPEPPLPTPTDATPLEVLPEPPPASAPLSLEPTGVSGLPFGTPAATVIEQVTAQLGAPVYDSGRVDAFGAFGTCQGENRQVAWGAADQTDIYDRHWLELMFVGDGDALAFVWWGVRDTGLPAEALIDVPIGTTLDELHNEYGEALRTYEDEQVGATAWQITLPTGMLSGYFDEQNTVDSSGAPTYPCSD
ncbi:MAG: hypothetical protein ACI867_000985 [Glaciecola sp.]|jgi:hypothetical protein